MTTIPAPAQKGPLAPYHDKEAWGEERFVRIGSSDVGAILGVDEYDTAAQKRWDRIVLGEREEIDSSDIRRGQKQEDIAARTFEERYGVKIRRHPMRVHPEYPFVVTDVDRMIITPEEWPAELAALMDPQEGPGALELKVPRIPNFYKMKEEGLPLTYVLQLQHQFSVTGWKWGVFAFYTPEYDDLIAFPVIRDDEFIPMMDQRVALWYESHVVGRVRPERPLPPPGRWPARPKGEAARREDPEWKAAADYMIEAEAAKEQARIRHEAAEANLVALLAENEHYVAGHGVQVKRYSTTSQRRFDVKAFRAAVKLAQQEKDTDALLTIDPEDDAFYYQTEPSEKIDVKVTARKEGD